ncbi:thymidylate synthase [Flavobacterium filum]|uniref:thymidylate synthase n=1 Tax=Flavobacterium filum TaxID=370974 RepID=UPI0023F5274A|nr:thymidylate synthase [Flavobacterium filum]
MRGVNKNIRQLLQDIIANGRIVEQDESSIYNNDNILELLNCQLVFKEPKNRIFVSKSFPQLFNPGLAIARFFFLLSGSNLIDSIKFYTEGVSRFSDDGITLSGSSYGYKIFSDEFGVSQYSRVINLLKQRRHTKRAAISIYQREDCGRKSKDIPCCMSIIFSPRGEYLHFTVHMRANNILKLLPYNIFEFSLLFEFIASFTGYRMGDYYHISTSAHFPAPQLSLAKELICESNIVEHTMKNMPIVNDSTRLNLISQESELRKFLINYSDTNELIKKIQSIIHSHGSYWGDYFITLAFYHLQKKGLHHEANLLSDSLMDESFILLKTQMNWKINNNDTVKS